MSDPASRARASHEPGEERLTELSDPRLHHASPARGFGLRAGRLSRRPGALQAFLHRVPLRRSRRLTAAGELRAYRSVPSFWQQLSNDMGRPILAAPHHPQPWLWPDQGLHAAWLGHSTVLVKADGFLFITDPVLSSRVGVNLGLMTVGMKRLVHSALGAHEIPTPDLILLSHAHMDHFDLPSLRDLEHPRTSVVTATSTTDLLRIRRYGSVAEVRWGESCRVGPATIRGLEVNHWGARMRSDTYRGYNGYLVDVGRFRVMFGGDTAFTHQFKRVRSSRKIDLAIMPIGAYNPWIRVHCSPEQAWTMANHAGAEFVLPVHHQTFLLGRESPKEPLQRLLDAADPFPERICLREIGQEFHLD